MSLILPFGERGSFGALGFAFDFADFFLPLAVSFSDFFRVPDFSVFFALFELAFLNMNAFR